EVGPERWGPKCCTAAYMWGGLIASPAGACCPTLKYFLQGCSATTGLYGLMSGGTGGASRIKVMVTRRLVAIEGSSGNSGWVSAFSTTLEKWAGGTPSGSQIPRTALDPAHDTPH